MFWLKCCPKCNKGDLYQSGDVYGRYITCLQCGYYLTEAEEVALRYASNCGSISHTKKEASATLEPVMAGGRR